MGTRFLAAVVVTALTVGGVSAADLNVNRSRAPLCPGYSSAYSQIPFFVPAGHQIIITSVRLINQVTHFNIRRKLATDGEAVPCTWAQGYKAGEGDIVRQEGVDYAYVLSGTYFGDFGSGYGPMQVTSTKYIGTTGLEVEMSKQGSANPHVRVTINW